jgi:hypothetical protein
MLDRRHPERPPPRGNIGPALCGLAETAAEMKLVVKRETSNTPPGRASEVVAR